MVNYVIDIFYDVVSVRWALTLTPSPPKVYVLYIRENVDIVKKNGPLVLIIKYVRSDISHIYII